MTAEHYRKSAGGANFFTLYFRYGQVLISVADIKTETQQDAIKKAATLLQKAINEL